MVKGIYPLSRIKEKKYLLIDGRDCESGVVESFETALHVLYQLALKFYFLGDVMDSLWSVLFGAAIASIVPIMTLVLSSSRWRKEKMVEHLRLKYERMEKVYLEVNEAISPAVSENNFPSLITSKIYTFGSVELKKIFEDYISNKNNTDMDKRLFIFKMSAASNRHLISIEKKLKIYYRKLKTLAQVVLTTYS